MANIIHYKPGDVIILPSRAADPLSTLNEVINIFAKHEIDVIFIDERLLDSMTVVSVEK